MEILLQLYFDSEWITREIVQLRLPFYRIGRSPKCEICIGWHLGRTLSAVQATLYEAPQTMRRTAGYSFRDGEIGKPSTNGCFMSGQRIAGKIRLFHQDIINLAPGLRMIYSNPLEIRVSDQLEVTLSDNTDALVNLAQ